MVLFDGPKFYNNTDSFLYCSVPKSTQTISTRHDASSVGRYVGTSVARSNRAATCCCIVRCALFDTLSQSKTVFCH